MATYEKLGVFYLGRHYHLAARQRLPDLLLYNSNDLVTHALCVGMTGSGKTGLCVDLIEEAAIDGIPALVIDPKGDLANLLLTFPDLQPHEFEPWVNPDDARKHGLSPQQFAARQAELWRAGLAAWDQDGARVRRLRDAADFVLYTPGSQAGVPVSILDSFAAPPKLIRDEIELLRERVNTTVASVLGLLGLEVDPTRSREAVLLANLLQHAWQKARDLDLAGLIQEIQRPSLTRIGVMDVETFFPAADRFQLATALNGLLASPGFGAWLEGEPLDIGAMLHTPVGKPRVAIFSIAHLSDPERMFFVTLLLNQVLGWMRSQSGTSSLRALLYMDEIFGYFPPVANPPSKLPLLTLLKQGRAFGVGVVLASQNPVDLDYRGLANIGTWFLGRLQTERDKQRVLDGLEGAAAQQGSAFDRAHLERTLSSLGNRVFLLHNVHDDGPAVFESRWALSYLRGPLSRPQIRQLMDLRRTGIATASADPAPSAAAAGSALADDDACAGARPALPPGIPQFFLPPRTAAGPLVYQAALLGAAQVRFLDSKARVDVTETPVLLAAIRDAAIPVDWTQAEDLDLDLNDLERDPQPGARFLPLPPPATQAKQYPLWSKDLVQTLFSTRKRVVYSAPRLGEASRPEESETEFRVRLQQTAREQRDAASAKLRSKYAPKIATLNERLRRAEQAVEREAGQARQAKLSTVISFGTTLLGAFLGRKTLSASNLGRAGTTLKGVGRSLEQSQDVARATETVEAVRQQLAELDAQFQAEVNAAEARFEPGAEPLVPVELRPGKSAIDVRLVALVWVPHHRDARGSLTPAC